MEAFEDDDEFEEGYNDGSSLHDVPTKEDWDALSKVR